MTPEGAQEGIIQEFVGGLMPSISPHQHDLQTSAAAGEDDVVYDKPVIKQGKGPPAGGGVKAGGCDDIKVPAIVDLSTLFDDPGYTKGLNLAGEGGGDSKTAKASYPYNGNCLPKSVHQIRRVASHQKCIPCQFR